MVPKKLLPLYYNDPIVHHCMQAYLRGLPLETALVECVVALARQSDDMQKRVLDLLRNQRPVYVLSKGL